MTSTTPLVDVVIPMHNASATILRALRSLQAQSISDWRAIVIDDASEDDSAQVVSSMNDPRVGLVSQSHCGVSGARNHGLRISDARFVCFLDADDTLEPSYLAELLPVAEKTECGVMCGCSVVDACGEPIFPISPPSIHALDQSMLLSMDCPPIMSILHTRQSLNQISRNGKLFDEQLDAFEDWDMLMRLARQFGSAEQQWGVVTQTLCSYWCTPMSLSADPRRVHDCGLAMIQRYGQADCRRAWRLRSWSACVAMQSQEMANELLIELGGLRQEDLGIVLGSLRWQVCRRHAVRHEKLGEWSSALTRFLKSLSAYQDSQAMIELIEDIRSWGGDRWTLAVINAAKRVEGDGRLVIYGLGHNGQRVCQAARALRRSVMVMDDDPTRVASFDQQILLDELRADDFVLVSPDDSAGMLSTITLQTPAKAMSIRQLTRTEHPDTAGARQ